METKVLQMKRRISDRSVMSGLLLVVAAGTPLVYILGAEDPYYLPKAMFLVVMTIGLSYFSLRSKDKPPFERDTAVFLLLAYLFLCVLSTIFANDILIAVFGNLKRWDGLTTILCYIALFFFAKRWYVYKRVHLDVIIGIGCLLAIYGILQHFNLDPFPKDPGHIGWGERPYATFGNPDFMGAWLSMLLPIAWFAWISLKKWRYLAATSSLFWCFLYVSTRSAWVGVFVGTVLLLVLAARLKLSWKPLLLSFIVMAAIFVISDSGVFGDGQPGFISDRLLTIVDDAASLAMQEEGYENGGSGRIAIWQNYLKMLWERPILGFGLENTGFAYIAHYGGMAVVDKAHNEYLHVAVTTGLPSALCYLAFLAIIFIRGLRTVWMSADQEHILRAGLLFAVACYCVQAFFNISVVCVGYIFWILLGILSKRRPVSNI